MTSHLNVHVHPQRTSNRRASLAFLTLIPVLLAVLSLSGCTGLTGAATPTANSSTTTNSNDVSSGTLAANATSFSFGNVVIGTSVTQTLTLSNTGTSTVNISQGTVAGAGFSVVGGMSSVAIAGGQNHAFQIQFAPTSSGNASGGIVIASDATNSSLGITLSGTGMQSLTITTQPASQTVTAGQTANFSVVATGSGTLTYQWKKNNTAISGATSASYTTPATTSADNNAQFAVVVTDANGNTTSNPATLTVTAAPVAPSITTQPANATVTAGQTATFSVTATGTAPLTYQWKKNNSAISGATSASYTTPATAASDNNAQFAVTVTNSVNSVTSNAATLTVNVPPSITTQPANQTVTAGQTATFSVAATGTGTMSYQWKKNGANIGGATSTSYTTPATIASDNGAQFTVTVTDNAGNVTSNAATLTVNVPASITTQPANQTVTAGQTAKFSVTASGTAPMTYQWSKNGTTIGGATAASYTTPATVASDNNAKFTVLVTNAFGNATSNAATLTVNVPPTISSQPVNQTVTVGQTATFGVTASGTGTLTYQWRKNGTTIGGATSASYTTPATVAADNNAKFTVVVTGTSGNVTSNAATLTVNVPPSITTQPTSKTVIAGQTATFTVAASGTAPMTYQWNLGTTPIGGAISSSYTTPVTTTANSGTQYNVTVTNVAGTATSANATLTVNAATFLLNPVQTNLNFSTVNVGSNSVLPVVFTNAGNSNVTISNVIVSGSGYTASGVQSGQIMTPGQTATLNVTFAPAGAGNPVTGNVSVTSNATNSPASISMTAIAVQPVAHSVTLSWTASVSTVAGYNVYRSSVSGGPYTKLNSSLVTTLSYTDSTVQAGQTYFYVVTSVDTSGVESADSSEVSTTIPTP